MIRKNNKQQQHTRNSSVLQNQLESKMTKTSKTMKSPSMSSSVGVNNNNNYNTNITNVDQMQQKASSKQQQQQQPAKLIKKAFVRFDDYLDLNEENMRRSCKRLMNHLYSEPTSSTSSHGLPLVKCTASTPGVSINNKAAIQVLKSPAMPTSRNKILVPNSPRAAHSPSAIIIGTTTQATASSTTTGPTTITLPSTSEKSYLRSQYERRQQRQLELMQQYQASNSSRARSSSSSSNNNNMSTDGASKHIADGANAIRRQRRQQQDLIIDKSHELSKRRFFEKLERRESMKNLNFSTPNNKQVNSISTTTTTTSNNNNNNNNNNTKDNAVVAESAATLETNRITLITHEMDQKIDDERQKNTADDELMLKVYQSNRLIEQEDRSNNENNEGSIFVQATNDDCTLGGLDGTQMRELMVGELFGFYTPSPQSPLELPVVELDQERLIEFSVEQENSTKVASQIEVKALVSNVNSTVVVTDEHCIGDDQSGFEIKVLEKQRNSNLDSLDNHLAVDGFINSNLLVVKQVEASVEIDKIDKEESESAFKMAKEKEKEKEEKEELDRESRQNLMDLQSVACNDCLPPTSNGRLKEKSSFYQLLDSNKTKTLLPPSDANFIGNNKIISTSPLAEQINGTNNNESIYDEEVMASNQLDIKAISVGFSASLPSSEKESDNQRAVGNISATISSSNNNNNNNTNNDNNRMGMVQLKVEHETTSHGGSVCNSTDATTLNSSAACGALIKSDESVCFKDHEAPETRQSQCVGQYDCAELDLAKKSALNVFSLESANPFQIRNAAQQQQQQQHQKVASLQTTTLTSTNSVIRDVLPEANGIDQEEAIVSGMENEKKEKVTYKQVNEIQQQQQQQMKKKEKEKQRQEQKSITQDCGLEENKYANAVLTSKQMHKNNIVDHEVNELESNNNNSGRNIDLRKARKKPHLIEPLNKKHSTNDLVGGKKENNSNLPEEDGGSSCSSSSGFGASVSVTSSSDIGCNSVNNNLNSDGGTSIGGIKCELFEKRPTSLAVMSMRNNNDINDESPECNPLYDSIRSDKNTTCIKSVNEFPDYKRLVGPDQAYPMSRTTFLIDNHSYAALLNRDSTSQVDASIVLVPDESLSEGYANLPRNNKDKHVEYATIKVQPETNSIVNNNNKQQFNNNTPSEASLSGQSYSTISANSGGFSTLPPVRFECSQSNVNNFESLVSLNETSQEKRKSSLLKRFGSLVSKAFSATSGPQSTQTSKIAESLPITDDRHEKEEKITNSDGNTKSGGQSKTVLVIESDHQVVSKDQLGGADLVILPTKHVNQKIGQKLVQQKLQHDKETTSMFKKNNDDKLSRTKRHSYKLKQADSSSSISSESSKFSSSSILKKSDSLSEDLESLMNKSEHSICYYKKNSKSHENRTKSSSRQNIVNKFKRIDIDCVHPNKTGEQTNVVGETKPNSQRSLLSLLNPATNNTQRVGDSTPNLNNPKQNGHYLDKFEKGNKCELDSPEQAINSFWGFSSLMGHNHATEAISTTKGKLKSSKQNRKIRNEKSNSKNFDQEQNHLGESQSLMYSNLGPYTAGYSLQISSSLSHEQELDKYQSLNLYQNLLRNYTKRRHHRHHQHHHHHHNHHNNRWNHSSTSRHTHHSARCSHNFGSICQSSGSESSDNSKALVSGQLVKINKSDGSQVIELQRCPGKSWGFFVARGAINNVKGIFISRIHDSVTSNSLTGLLSIGDRIIAIDDCLIEPDYDILRVNQMISKKSKILLKVKPFKG